VSTTEVNAADRLNQLRNLDRQPRAGIMEEAVCVKVELRRPGTMKKVAKQVNVADKQASLIDEEKTRSVPLINADVQTDLEMLKVSKKVIDAPEMEAIQKLDTQIRRFLMTRALPSIFQAGVYLIPDNLVPEVDMVLQNFSNTRKGLVQELITALPRIKSDSKERLCDLSEDNDVLVEEKMAAAFSMKFEYISYGVNEKLRKINADLFEREKVKSEERFREAEDQIKLALRIAMADLTAHMVDRLTGGQDGKRKVFKKTMLTTMNEFLENFNSRNIVKDKDLEGLVDKAKQLLAGVDPETLRENEGLRDGVLHGFEQVKTQLDTMLENAPVRMMRLADED
jgi:hypothetical protein